MAVKFLSDEWLKEVEACLNAHDGVQAAAKGQQGKLQNVVTGAPDGEARYFFLLDGGQISIGRGDTEGPDATLTNDYETAVAMSKQEITGQAAFMQGKMKIAGNLMKVMQLQGVFNVMPAALAGLEVEY